LKNYDRIMLGRKSSWKEVKSNTAADLEAKKVQHMKSVTLKEGDDSDAVNPRTRSN